MTSLQGRRILLTGGGSGIGQAVTVAYVRAGAQVLVVERSADHARTLVERTDGMVEVIVADATDPDVLDEAAARCVGDGGLDHLTCCVGVFDNYTSLRQLGSADLEKAWDELYRTNVLGTLQAVRAAAPALRAARGSVTLTISESAFVPSGGGVLYGSSKWALRGAVEHLAVDLAPLVRVNGVAPGGTSGTKFGGLRSLGQQQTADVVDGRDERIAAGTLIGRASTPEDHVGAYLYLADPVASAVVTGTVLRTDGGRRAS